MRYRLLASYQGAPYEVGVGPTGSDVVLFAACPPPEDLQFEPATGHWRKPVSRAEVQALHESRPVGLFRGDRCVVLDDLGDRLHIAYLGHDALRAEQLGYWEVDRGVFELITPRQEVTDIVEQRLPFPPPPPPAAPPPLTPAPAAPPPVTSAPAAPPPVTPAPAASPPAHFAPGPAEVLLPPVPEPPLPVEAEARRASAARRGLKDPGDGVAGPLPDGGPPAQGALPLAGGQAQADPRPPVAAGPQPAPAASPQPQPSQAAIQPPAATPWPRSARRASQACPRLATSRASPSRRVRQRAGRTRCPRPCHRGCRRGRCPRQPHRSRETGLPPPPTDLPRIPGSPERPCCRPARTGWRHLSCPPPPEPPRSGSVRRHPAPRPRPGPSRSRRPRRPRPRPSRPSQPRPATRSTRPGPARSAPAPRTPNPSPGCPPCPPRGDAGQPGGGCQPSGSSPSWLPRRPSQRALTRSARTSTAPCAWSGPRRDSRSSTRQVARGTRSACSPTRNRPISTCSGCLSPRRSGPETSRRACNRHRGWRAASNPSIRLRSRSVSMSSGRPVSPHSTSVTRSGLARRKARAPASPTAAEATAAQCPRAIITGLRGRPS